jgi:predicted permease
LLISAAITLSGAMRLVNEPGGFDPERLLRVQILLPENRYQEPDRRREFVTNLVSRMQTLATVERVAVANILPASGWNPAAPLAVEHQPRLDDPLPQVGHRIVSDNYFETMDIPLVSGRAFTALDREGSLPVAIISASVAERFWRGGDPVGRHIRLGEPLGGWLQIVGVVGDVRMYNWWDGEDLAAVYQPLRQAVPPLTLQAVVRTRGEPTSSAPAVRDALRSVDPLLPAQDIRTMQQAISTSSLGLTHMAAMIGICGGIALLLSILAIYSTMAYSIAQRSAEFGVRLALGATGADVLRLALRQAATLTITGLGIGILLAMALGRAMAGALFGVVSLDGMTFVGVVLALAIVSFGAAYFPARRALRVDPATVLRTQ